MKVDDLRPRNFFETQLETYGKDCKVDDEDEIDCLSSECDRLRKELADQEAALKAAKDAAAKKKAEERKQACIKKMKEMQSKISNAGKKVVGFFKDLGGAIVKGAKAVFEGAKKLFTWGKDKAKKAATTIADKVKHCVAEGNRLRILAGNQVKEALRKTKDGAKKLIDDFKKSHEEAKKRKEAAKKEAERLAAEAKAKKDKEAEEKAKEALEAQQLADEQEKIMRIAMEEAEKTRVKVTECLTACTKTGKKVAECEECTC